MMSADRLRRAAGHGMSGLVIAFMLFDAGMKLVPLDVVITATAELGYPPSPALARGLGLVALACTLLYALPRTAVLGAILLTAYMGGTVATHLRVSYGRNWVMGPIRRRGWLASSILRHRR